MSQLMRCQYCGVLQDEPAGAKVCIRCGGELAFESGPPPDERASYVKVQMELDQVAAPAGQNVERHLLITLQTPAQVPPEQAARSQAGRPPLSFTAVLDVSGSMGGGKLLQAKDAVRQALSRLREGDSLALVTFSSDVRCVLEPTPVSDQSRRVVESALQEIVAGGMTALCGGLELGLKKALTARQDTNLVLLLSDGQANVGETDVEKVGQRGRRARRKGIIVSTLGVGDDYNEALMVEIATQGNGRFYHIRQPDQIAAYLTGELGEVACLAARDVHIRLTIPAGVLVVPLSAAYAVQQDGNQVTVAIGDVPSDVEREVPIRITLPGQPLGSKLSFEGALEYRSPAGNRLRSSLNRVTVRFVEQAAFHLRDGVVVPVVERVLEHIKATSVLGVSRAMVRSAAEAYHQADTSVSRLRAYAALLGDERAAAEAQQMEGRLGLMRAAPASAKAYVSYAFSRAYSTKSFDSDDSSS